MSTLQHTLHHLPNHAEVTADSLLCADTYLAAEYELAAFTTAVRRTSGDGAAERAGIYWLQEFDLLTVLNPLAPITAATWRKLTIQAASRLADESTAKAPCGRAAEQLNHFAASGANEPKGIAVLARKWIATAITHIGAFAVYVFKDLILLMLSL